MKGVTNMKIAIVGLNSDKVFILTPYQNNNYDWRQYKIPLETFISIMWHNFEVLMTKSKPYHFTNPYQLCNWLFNYGYESGDTIVFDNNKCNYLTLDKTLFEESPSNFMIRKNTTIYNERK